MFSSRPEYNSPKYKAWRYGVFKNFQWTCALCHEKGKPLEAHHIMRVCEYPNLQFLLSNGICLCRDCHQYKVTGHEKDYERQFKEIIAQKKIQNIHNREQRTGRKKKSRPKYRPRDPKLRF